MTPTPVVLVAQQPAESKQYKECEFPLVAPSEVDRKAKILSKPHPKFTDKEIVKHSGQVVILGALLCGSGKVTNIKVLRGVSDVIDAKSIEVSRKIRFNPAEKDGGKVSTWITLEYRIQVITVR
jgi:TonB family protein